MKLIKSSEKNQNNNGKGTVREIKNHTLVDRWSRNTLSSDENGFRFNEGTNMRTLQYGT